MEPENDGFFHRNLLLPGVSCSIFQVPAVRFRGYPWKSQVAGLLVPAQSLTIEVLSRWGGGGLGNKSEKTRLGNSLISNPLNYIGKNIETGKKIRD